MLDKANTSNYLDVFKQFLTVRDGIDFTRCPKSKIADVSQCIQIFLIIETKSSKNLEQNSRGNMKNIKLFEQNNCQFYLKS